MTVVHVVMAVRHRLTVIFTYMFSASKIRRASRLCSF